MAIPRFRVTLKIFSGRPDPVWDLPEKEGLELAERVTSLTTPTINASLASLKGLGYRGVEVREVLEDQDQPVFRLYGGIAETRLDAPNLVDSDGTVEQWLLDTAPSEVVQSDVWQAVRNEIERHRAEDFSPDAFLANVQPSPGCPPSGGSLAPSYNPGKWNTPSVQPRNNCYNYANDIITNTFAQPGRASGSPITTLRCDDVVRAARADGLSPVPTFQASIAGAYVAVVVWPSTDYHWYRQDDNGCWSHKPGQTAARNYDNRGNPISDPAQCDRGPYADFCGYMTTDPGSVRIG